MQKHLVIIGTVWPEPNSTAAGSRMLQLIALFQKDNYSISFLSSAKKSEFSFPLESQDIDEEEDFIIAETIYKSNHLCYGT